MKARTKFELGIFPHRDQKRRSNLASFLKRRDCSFCACDLLFDWSRDMRRVITLSFPVQAKTRSTNRTRASRHSNSAAILGRSFVPRALKVAVSHTIIGPRETVANYGEGAKNSDRAAAGFGLNQPIKSRQSHCRREGSVDRLLFFTRRTRLPGAIGHASESEGISES